MKRRQKDRSDTKYVTKILNPASKVYRNVTANYERFIGLIDAEIKSYRETIADQSDARKQCYHVLALIDAHLELSKFPDEVQKEIEKIGNTKYLSLLRVHVCTLF